MVESLVVDPFVTPGVLLVIAIVGDCDRPIKGISINKNRESNG